MKMKSPFSSPPFTRLSSGFRSCAVAFSICAVLASGEARADDSPSDNSLPSEELELVLRDVLNYYLGGNPVQPSPNTINDYARIIARSLIGSDLRFKNLLLSVVGSVPADSITNLLQVILDGNGYRSPDTLHGQLDVIQGYVQALSVGVASNSNLVELLHSSQQLEAYQSDLAYNLYNLWNAYQSAGYWHVWVDNLDTIEDWVIYAGGELSNIDSTLAWLAQEGFPVHGEMSIEGDVSILGTVDANVLNWPQYFTGYYDEQNADNVADVTYELTEASGEYEDGWNSQTGDMDQQVLDAEEAVADPTSVEDVTNAVDRVHLPSSSEVDGTLPIRQSVFDAVGDDLLGNVDRNFNSSVLILPKNDAAGIIKLEWDGNDDAWQSFLETSGTLFENVWKVLYAVWLMFLIWHEYNFYFRTIH